MDGVTAAGKTTFARDLAAAIGERGRSAIHLSMDGFHHPRAHRHRQGRDSAVGYYEDAYDFGSFARTVLDPLGPGGDLHYRRRIIDLAADTVIEEPSTVAAVDSILVVDGSFLLRPELAGGWDQSIYLDADFAVARERGARRDAELFGGVEQAARAFEARYHAACRRYLAEVDPAAHATVLVGHDDPEHPVLRRIGGDHAATVALFSYGTLQLQQVQLSNFDRLLAGVPDTLPEHRTDWVTITDPDVIAASGTDRHPIVHRTGDRADAVAGTAFTITTTELAAADHYEVDDYRRVLAVLGSGTSAWVYLALPEPAHP